MEDDFFEELEQAAVDGAEGTWGLPDLTPLHSLPPLDTKMSTGPTHTAPVYAAPAPTAPIPIPTKAEPQLAGLPSSPPQPSFCSLASTASTMSTPASLASSPLSPLCGAPGGSSGTLLSSSLGGASLSTRRTIPSGGGGGGMGLGSSSSPSPSLLSTSVPIDLAGTTAARSRKMTDEERKLMLHKRRLRNRASAARSREKRSRTLHDLTTEVEDLLRKSAALAHQANQAVEEARKLRARNVLLSKENELLKAQLNL